MFGYTVFSSKKIFSTFFFVEKSGESGTTKEPKPNPTPKQLKSIQPAAKRKKERCQPDPQRYKRAATRSVWVKSGYLTRYR